MRIRLRSGDAALDVDLVACFAFEGDAAPLGIGDPTLREALAAEMKARKFAGRRGDLFDGTSSAKGRAKRLLVMGLGDRRVSLAEASGDASARAVRAAGKVGARSVGLVLPKAPAASASRVIRMAAEGALLGAYRFDRYLSDPLRAGEEVEALEIAAPAPAAAGRRA